MKRVEYSTNCEIVDDVTEKLKDYNMTYDDLSDFVFDYKEAIENIKEWEDKLNDIKKEIRDLGIEELFHELYDNSEFSVYEADF